MDLRRRSPPGVMRKYLGNHSTGQNGWNFIPKSEVKRDENAIDGEK